MLVRLEDVKKYYGAASVLRGATATIHPGDRIGIVGRNGAGKSTLLHLISGAVEPDGGHIHRSRRVRIGTLQQTHESLEKVTLQAHLMGAFTRVRAEWDEMKRLEQEMSLPGVASDPARLEQTLEAYSRATEAFERGGGYESEARLKETTHGLGFGEDALDRSLGSLSGGEQVRASLARLLLDVPDLLLLDEPTNHLDMSAIEWLERTLRSIPGALVIVSHDRSLLDAVADNIWEVDDGRVDSYRGNYSAYARQRAEKESRQRKLFDAQQKEIARLEAYVDKYRAGNRATMAKSRERRLARMKRVEAPKTSSDLALRMNADGLTGRVGRTVLELEEVAKRYGGRNILRGLDLLVGQGDRLGVVGPNGCGKSTLVRILAGVEPPEAGEVRWGEGAQIGYFSQEMELIRADGNVMDELAAVRPMPEANARNFLARFLFTGEEVLKPVSALSGGERNRLQLAKLLLEEPNVLLLDEPTNHLDLPAREALETALLDYEGTVVAVSHDRRFLERIATRVLSFEPPAPSGQGAGGASTQPAHAVHVFEGGYADFRAWKSERRADLSAGQEARSNGRGEPAAAAANSRRGDAQKSDRPGGEPPGRDGNRREAKRAPRPASAKEVARVEEEIMRLEGERDALAARLADPSTYRDGGAAKEAVQAHERIEQRLAELYASWESAVEASASEDGSHSPL